MTGETNESKPASLSSEQPYVTDMDKMVWFMASHPARMATLLALSALPVGQYATRGQLAQHLDDLQGEVLGWEFAKVRHLPYEHCTKWLSPLGLVEFGPTKTAHGRPSTGVRISDRGRIAGLAVAGTLFTPEFNPESGPFLYQVIGAVQQIKDAPMPLRLAIYQELMRHPKGTATVAELYKKVGRSSFGNVARTVEELCTLGILERVGKTDPLARSFMLGERQGKFKSFRADMKPELQAITKALTSFFNSSITQVTGADIVAEALKINPDLDGKAVWEKFIWWFKIQQAASFIKEITSDEPASQFGQVRIAEACWTYIAGLLQVIEMLKRDDDEGSLFRTLSRERAQKIVNNPRLMSSLLATARKGSRWVEGNIAPDWTRSIDQYVPAEGIATDALHRIVTDVLGRSIAYVNFRSRLAGVESLEIIERRQIGGHGLASVVMLKVQTFPLNWEDQAKCLAEDPELFFPEDTRGPAGRQQAETAKRLCRSCPVRLPCLRDALVRKLKFGIRGGVWLEKQDNELPQAEKERILQRVRIRRKEESRDA